MPTEASRTGTSTPRSTTPEPERKRRRCTVPQPLAALHLDGALLRIDVVVAASGLSRATLYRAASEGRLEMIRIGRRCTRIRSEVAREFIKNIGAA